MKWSSIVLGCVGFLSACGKDAPPPPRGLVDVDGRPLLGALERPARAAEGEIAAPEPSAPEMASPFATGEEPAAAAPAPAAPAKEEEKKRDLEQELLAALPQPTSCLDLAKVAAGGGKLTISVSAEMLPSGHISRATVSAPGQSADAIKCLQKGAVAVTIAPDVPGAPLTLRVNSTIEAIAQAKPQAKPQEETPQAPGRYVYKPLPPPPGVEFARPEPGVDVARADGTDFAQASE